MASPRALRDTLCPLPSNQAIILSATLHDAEGSWRRRFLVPAIAGALGFAALFTFSLPGKVGAVVMAAAVAIGMFSRVLTPRASSRRAEVVCTKGRVRIRNAGLLNRELRPKDIEGATTARHGDHFVLSLGIKDRQGKPVHLELATEEDVKTVCDALGIGHYGVGVVGFSLRARPRDLCEIVVRSMAGLLWTTFAVALLLGPSADGVRTLSAVFGVVMTNLAALLWVMRKAPSPQIVLRADGAHQGMGNTWQPIAYGALDAIATTKDTITLSSQIAPLPAKPSTWLADGMSPAEREILVSQLQSAAARAHGHQKIKEQGPSTLDTLRRNGATVSQWLDRLDGVAASVVRVVGGYRGATFDVADLWRVFEDPDGEWELRVGAGRMLKQIAPQELAIRVAPVLETVRDERVKKRISLALDPDTARAQYEMAALEEAELTRERLAGRRAGRLRG